MALKFISLSSSSLTIKMGINSTSSYLRFHYDSIIWLIHIWDFISESFILFFCYYHLIHSNIIIKKNQPHNKKYNILSNLPIRFGSMVKMLKVWEMIRFESKNKY